MFAKKITQNFLAFLRLLQVNFRINKALIFIGPARSGTTFFSNMLNQHPKISVLPNPFGKVMERKVESLYFKNLIKNKKKITYESLKLNIFGFENYEHYGSTINKYQKKWIKSNFKYEKKEIKVVSIESSGEVADLAITNQNSFDKLITENKEKIFFLFLVRNPQDVCESYLKSHPHKFKNIKSVCDFILAQSSICNQLANKNEGNFIKLFYEDLCNNPSREIKNFFNILKIDYSETLIANLSLSVNKSKTKNKVTNLYIKEKILSLNLEKLYDRYL